MPASTSDYFSKVSNGSQALPTQLASQKLTGATTASLNASTGWDTTTGKHIRMYQTTVDGGRTVPDQSTICFYKGTLLGTTLSNLTLVWSASGSDQTYPAGATVDLVPSTSWADALTAGILTHADQDGTLKADAVDVTAVIKDDIITNAKMVAAIKPETNFGETTFDYVASGCVITGDSYGTNLKWSMTAGVVYIGGRRVVVGALSAQDVTASKDTYIDVSNAGTVTFTGGNSVANNAASPALAASYIRLGIIVSGANITSVASVNQGQETKVLPIASSIPYAVTDSLGNLICPRDPNRKILGYRQILSNFSCTVSTVTDVTGLSMPVIVPTTRKVKVSVYASSIYQADASGGNDRGPSVYLAEGATVLQVAAAYGSLNNTLSTPAHLTYISSPSAGSHTYKAQLGPGAFGTSTLRASSTSPAFIMVELV
jgi:hypothetical protein